MWWADNVLPYVLYFLVVLNGLMAFLLPWPSGSVDSIGQDMPEHGVADMATDAEAFMAESI